MARASGLRKRRPDWSTFHHKTRRDRRGFAGVMFEPLPSRVLLSGSGVADLGADGAQGFVQIGGWPDAVQPFGEVNGESNVKLKIVDENGTKLTFSIKGPATGQLVDTGSDDSTKVQIKTRGGDGQVQLGNVDLMGSARGLIGPNVDLSGSIYVDGMLDKLAIGDFTGGSFVMASRTVNTSVCSRR